MEVKLLINLILSIIGIIIFYLIRRTEINKKIKVCLLNLKKETFSILRGEFILLLNTNMILLNIMERMFSYIINRYQKNSFKVMRKMIKKERKKVKKVKNTLYKYAVYKHEDKKIENYNSISDILIDKCLKRNDNLMIGMFIYITINYYLYFFTNINLKDIIFLLLTILIWLIVIDQILLIYRNKKGYYGTNYDEAMELIYFMKQSSNDDINTSSGMKVLNEEEREDTVASGRKVLV